MTSSRDFALAAHGQQMYGDQPYIFHLDQVAALATQFGQTAIDVAHLHYTIEDAGIRFERLVEQFGSLTARCVALVTDPPGANRKERKVKLNARLALVSGELEIALVVKICDRLCNARNSIERERRSLWQMNHDEHADFRVAVFRPGLCDHLWAELDEVLVDGMYERLVGSKHQVDLG